MGFAITGMTLSVEFADTQYGAGTKSFLNLHARVPEGEAVPVDNPQEAISAGLDMYLTAWLTLMNARRAVKTVEMSKEDYDKYADSIKERIQRLKGKLHE